MLPLPVGWHVIASSEGVVAVNTAATCHLPPDGDKVQVEVVRVVDWFVRMQCNVTCCLGLVLPCRSPYAA